MGSHYLNVQVKCSDRDGVVALLIKETNRFTPSYVTGGDDGWVSIYPDDMTVDTSALASMLSAEFDTCAFELQVAYSDVFLYTLYDRGVELDAYDSCPGYYDGGDSTPKGGNVQVLLPFCIEGTSAEQLTALLHPNSPREAAGVFVDMDKQVAEELHAAMESGLKSSMQEQRKNAGVFGKFRSWLLEKTMLSKLKMGFDKASSDGGVVAFGGDMLAGQFETLLGIADSRACTGFRYIESEGAINSWEDDDQSVLLFVSKSGEVEETKPEWPDGEQSAGEEDLDDD